MYKLMIERSTRTIIHVFESKDSNLKQPRQLFSAIQCSNTLTQLQATESKYLAADVTVILNYTVTNRKTSSSFHKNAIFFFYSHKRT